MFDTCINVVWGINYTEKTISVLLTLLRESSRIDSLTGQFDTAIVRSQSPLDTFITFDTFYCRVRSGWLWYQQSYRQFDSCEESNWFDTFASFPPSRSCDQVWPNSSPLPLLPHMSGVSWYCNTLHSNRQPHQRMTVLSTPLQMFDWMYTWNVSTYI